jgi:hypothetical protein
LDVGLDQREVEIAGGEVIDIVDRPARWLDGAAHRAAGVLMVGKGADRPARRIVETGDGACAERDELEGRRRHRRRQEHDRHERSE